MQQAGLLDIDGDGIVTLLPDIVMIIRAAFNYNPQNIPSALPFSDDATRTSWQDIYAHLSSILPPDSP